MREIGAPGGASSWPRVPPGELGDDRASLWLLSRSRQLEVRRARRCMPWTVGLVSPGQWLARLSSGNRLRRRVGHMESRLVLVCVWRVYVVSARRLLEQLPDTVHTAFACRRRNACCTASPSVHQLGERQQIRPGQTERRLLEVTRWRAARRQGQIWSRSGVSVCRNCRGSFYEL